MGKSSWDANVSESKKRNKGIATIKVGEDKCRVTFDDDAIEFDNGKNSKSFDLDDMPKYPKLAEGSKSYFVVLNPEADSVESVGPVEGVFPARFVEFNHEEDEDPKPLQHESTNPKWEPYEFFLAFFEITGGAYKKTRLPYFLHYKFEESRDNPGFVAWKGNPDNPKATRLHQLVKFCEKLGFSDEQMKWPEDGNILPAFQEIAEENPKNVKIVVENGYINQVLSADEEDEPEESADEEEKPAKSKAKPQTKRTPKHGDDEEDL